MGEIDWGKWIITGIAAYFFALSLIGVAHGS
jgi:hypothetical protein